MKIVGITGGIGCGKTFLAGIIKRLGFSVHNPDFWVRDLYLKSDFLKVIKHEFPMVFEDGVFNKRKLRQLVFDDNMQLKKLESLIHPFLGQKLKKLIHRTALKEDVLFLDVALLLEFNWDIYCDYIIVADVADELQKHREETTRDGFMVQRQQEKGPCRFPGRVPGEPSRMLLTGAEKNRTMRRPHDPVFFDFK